MDFEDFRRTFFPQYFQVEQDEGDGSDHETQKSTAKTPENVSQSQDTITARLYRLEQLIKDKFANNWVSVRKAFLDLDSDYDGFVTVDDILRFFGSEDKEMDFKDLTKLIIDKDHKKQGKINYTDFSKWMGGEIQKSEGFYFRHDSQRNPQYEKNIKIIT